MHATLNSLIYSGYKLFVWLVLASLAEVLSVVCHAGCKILRCGNRKDTTQPLNLLEERVHRAREPRQHLGIRGAEGLQVATHHATIRLALLRRCEVLLLQRARLIDVEIYLYAILCGACHKFLQSHDTRCGIFIARKTLIVGLNHHSQNRVYPNTIHTHLRQSAEQLLGVCRQLVVKQRIAKGREVGENHSQLEAVVVLDSHLAALADMFKLAHKTKSRLLGREGIREGCYVGGYACRACLHLGRRLNVVQRLAVGLYLAELGQKEIIFDKAEFQLLLAHTQQLRQLLIGQQMPITAQYGDVSARCGPLGLYALHGRQAHRCCQTLDILHRGG